MLRWLQTSEQLRLINAMVSIQQLIPCCCVAPRVSAVTRLFIALLSPQCDLHKCCSPVEAALNARVNNCTGSRPRLDCGCLGRNVSEDHGVQV